MKGKFTPAPELDDRSGKLGRPQWSLLGENSPVRIVAGELYRLGLRIRAFQDKPNPKFAVRLPKDARLATDSFLLNRNFALACSEHIQRQQSQYHWLGPLEAEQLAQAFLAGSQWGFRNPSIAACSEVHHS